VFKITNFSTLTFSQNRATSPCTDIYSLLNTWQTNLVQRISREQGRRQGRALKEDIRLLGRLLGDVLRDQEGEEVYAVVETIRQTAVRFRREADAGAAKELDGMLKILTREQTIPWCARFPISRTWPISPKTSTTSAAAAHLLAGSAAARQRQLRAAS
jgi:phosphoenolpyruvate carboxylase